MNIVTSYSISDLAHVNKKGFYLFIFNSILIQL